MKRSIPALISAVSLSLALAACGAQETEPGAADDTPAPTTEDAPPGDTTPGDDESTTEDEDMMTDDPGRTQIPNPRGGDELPLGPVDQSIVEREDVQAAIQAEADRSGVPPEEVEVAGYADVTWQDGSIGCPEPGMHYTMALVPGHQLILEVDGEHASYHAAEGRPFSHCASPRPPRPGDEGANPTI